MRRQHRLDARNFEQPVAFFINGYGDHFMSLPALRALAALFPRRLTLLCAPGAPQVFFNDLGVGRVIEVTTERLGAGRTFDAEVVAKAVGPCDLLLSLNPWHTSSVDELIDRLSPRESVGFFREFRHHVALDFTKHSSDLTFDVCRLFDASARLEDFAAPPALPSRSLAFAREIYAMLPEWCHILIIHTDTKAEKMWPARKFAQVLMHFLGRHREFAVFDVGGEDILHRLGWRHPRLFSCCGVPLESAFAMISDADLFLGVDSCMLHAADIFRVPGVALFGPTNPAEFGFRLGPHRHVVGAGRTASIPARLVVKALEDLLADEGSDGRRSPRRCDAARHSSL